jgi:hypothetical protein
MMAIAAIDGIGVDAARCGPAEVRAGLKRGDDAALEPFAGDAVVFMLDADSLCAIAPWRPLPRAFPSL